MSDNTRDRELAARLVSGDEAALREVYREHVAAVNGLAMRVLSNEALAEEVVQDVFVRLWEEPERFDEKIPSDLADVPQDDPFGAENWKPYLGWKFARVLKDFEHSL